MNSSSQRHDLVCVTLAKSDETKKYPILFFNERNERARGSKQKKSGLFFFFFLFLGMYLDSTRTRPQKRLFLFFLVGRGKMGRTLLRSIFGTMKATALPLNKKRD